MKLTRGSRQKNLGVALLKGRSSAIIGLGIAINHAGIDKCLNFMAKNYCKPIQLAELMEVSGFSRRGLHKAFNRCLGENPGAILRRVRIERAQRLLVEHDLKLKQIAELCGYRSENTFCVAFQRTMGVAPKQFQRRYWLAVIRRAQMGEIQPTGESRLLPSLPVEIVDTDSRQPKK